jgi:elongator complex protein 1
MERKVGSGRKGTVDEEEYLLKSITKLVARFGTTQGMHCDTIFGDCYSSQ